MAERAETATLSDSDSLMWRIEVDPVLRAPIIVLALLDRSPEPEHLAATLDHAVETVPQLRQLLVEPPLGLGRPVWHDTDRFSLDYHLRWVRAEGDDLRAVLDIAEPDVIEPFDMERPLWRLTVVDGLEGGRAALVLRFHHSIADGIGAIQLAEQIFDQTRHPAGSPATPTGEDDDAPATGPPVATPAPARLPGARALDAVGALTRTTLTALRHPATTVAESARFARSAVRMLAPTPSRGSPLLSGRGLSRRLHIFAVPLATLRAAASAASGTVNDVMLAAVGGALADYHRELGHPITTARVMMPINVRSADDEAGGNHFTMSRFVLPVDDPDPVMRTHIAGSIVRSWRSEPAVASTPLLAFGLNILPRPLAASVFGGLLRSMDVNVSNVTGLSRAAYLGGAQIERLWAAAPLVGAAFSVALISHQGTGCIAVTCDRTAVAEPDRLARLVEANIDELLALANADRGDDDPTVDSDPTEGRQ